MNQVIDFLTANTTLAYITAVVIFIITIYLLIRRLIGFMVSLLLLIFALISGLAIANHDLFREILVGFKTDPSAPKEEKYAHFKNQLNKTYEELKEEFQEQKERLQELYEAYSKPEKQPQQQETENP